MPRIIGFIIATAICLAAAASAARASGAPLDFYATPVHDAALRLDSELGVRVVLEPGINANRTVSFTVASAGTDSGRAFAIDSFAHELNANYHKVFFIRKASARAGRSQPPIDVDATMGFHARRLPAAQAVRMIASVDNDAAVRFITPVKGWVTLSNTQLSARQAAAEVARQTHTTWTAEYVLAPTGRQNVPRTDRIIGYTAGGQPITESPPITGAPIQEQAPAQYAHRSAPNRTAINQNAPTANNGQTYSFPTPPGYPYVYPYGYSPSTVGPSNAPMYEIPGSPFLYWGAPTAPVPSYSSPANGMYVLPNGTYVFGTH
jgi:hypothetical protein